MAVFIFLSTASFAESAAFGYFTNESGNESLDYLEKILPNSFASTLKNKHNFDIIKPGQIPVLTAQEDSGFKTEFREGDLPVLTEDINADYFIYGTFKPLENNKVLLKVSVYKTGTSSVFQFEQTGYLETEVFKLIDKIALQISNIASDSIIYKNDKVTAKSKLAIITNIEGVDLNSLYFEFLNGGYRLSPTQGNELYGIIDDEQINKFYHISGVNASYHQIYNRKEIELMYGTWSGADYIKKVSGEKQTFDQYAFNFNKTKNEILKKFKELNNSSIDYIVIIGFDECRSNAWVRCIDVKNNNLIITESGIKGSSISEITKNIIISMTTDLPAAK